MKRFYRYLQRQRRYSIFGTVILDLLTVTVRPSTSSAPTFDQILKI